MNGIEQLENEEYRSLAWMAPALWSQWDRFDRLAPEFVVADRLKNPQSPPSADRIAGLLLKSARGDGTGAILDRVSEPFFRLTPEERTLLALLHWGRWTYRRVGALLGLTAEQVAENAWACRVYLASQIGTLKGKAIAHPIGSMKDRPNCPEYQPAAPWTQKFLDKECAPAEKVFLENHLHNCLYCQQVLSKAREVYFGAQSLMPTVDPRVVSQKAQWLDQAFQQTAKVESLRKMTFARSLGLFLRRPDVLLALSIGIFIVLLAIRR